MKDAIRRHYYWVIAAVTFCEMTVFGGVLNNFSGLFLLPISQTLEVSRGLCASALSVASFTGFLSNVLSGSLFRRFGHRRLVTLGLLMAAFGLTLLALGQNLWMIGLGAALVGLSRGVCFTAGASNIVGSWFHRRQGVVLGFVTAASGVGGGLFGILLSQIMESNGWRAAHLFNAALMVVSALLVLSLSRNRPSDLQLRPYGEGEVTQSGKQKEQWVGYTMQELVRLPVFYLALFCMLLACVCYYMLSPVLIPYLQDVGLSATQAASVYSLSLLLLTFTKFIYGILVDKIGIRKVAILTLVCCVLSLVAATLVSGLASAYFAAVVISLSFPLTGLVMPVLGGELFGYRTRGNMVGFALAIVNISGTVSSPLINMLYDNIGSYRPVFQVTALVTVLVILLFCLLFRLADRNRKRHDAAHVMI